MQTGFIAIFLSFFLMQACQCGNTDMVPDELIGVWTTDEPKYIDSCLEITRETIVFKTGENYFDKNTVTDIDRLVDKERISYKISYENAQGDDYELYLYYYKSGNQDIVRFKNQKQIDWKKGRAT
jgi:hypothetical protein